VGVSGGIAVSTGIRAIGFGFGVVAATVVGMTPIAAKADEGLVLPRGWSYYDQCNVPAPNTAGALLAGNAALSAGVSRGGWTRVDLGVPLHRFGHALAYDEARGVTVLYGGLAYYQPSDSPSADQLKTLDDTWEWDGNTWVQRFPPTSLGPLAGHLMAYDAARGVTVLYGGVVDGLQSTEVYEWDGADWT
jgi:hypothetical protein